MKEIVEYNNGTSNGQQNELSHLAKLRQIRREGVREYGPFALKAANIRSALKFMRSPVTSKLDTFMIKRRALDILVSGSGQ